MYWRRNKDIDREGKRKRKKERTERTKELIYGRPEVEKQRKVEKNRENGRKIKERG